MAHGCHAPPSSTDGMLISLFEVPGVMTGKTVQVTVRARARDLDLGSGHTAYRRASLIDLYLHAKFH